MDNSNKKEKKVSFLELAKQIANEEEEAKKASTSNSNLSMIRFLMNQRNQYHR